MTKFKNLACEARGKARRASRIGFIGGAGRGGSGKGTSAGVAEDKGSVLISRSLALPLPPCVPCALAFYSALCVSSSLSLSFPHTCLHRDTNCFALVYAKLAVIAYAREAAGATGRRGTGPKRILQMSRRCLSYPLPFLVPCSRSCCADEPAGIFRPCRCMANVSLRRANRSRAIIKSEIWRERASSSLTP